MFHRTKPIVVACGFLTAVTAATSCAINPLTGGRELALIPESQEIQMGQEAAAEVDQTMGIYDNAALNQYVANLGKELSAKSERPDLPWSFKVVDDPAVNAFALPGGPIFVTRGLLGHLSSEAQLAAVMGHEIGHVTGRHAVRQMSKATLAQAGLMIGMAVSKTVADLGELGMGGLQLLMLSYGRDAEREADALGFRYSLATGFDVHEMPEVFNTLKRVSEAAGAGRLPNWMSSHPAPEERAETIQKKIAETNPPKGKVDRDSFLAVTDGIVYGADPRQGFFEGGVFKHPQLKFQVKPPTGWKTQNLPAALVAQPEGGNGGFQLTLAKGATPAEALKEFQTNQAITDVTPLDLPLTGPGVAARFSAKTEEAQMRGLTVFISHGGKVYQLMGLGTADGFAGLEPTIIETAKSFAPLNDPAALAVQPARIKLISVPQAMTVAELAAKYPSLPADRLAILNQADKTTQLQPGQKVKIVEGKVRDLGGS